MQCNAVSHAEPDADAENQKSLGAEAYGIAGEIIQETEAFKVRRCLSIS